MGKTEERDALLPGIFMHTGGKVMELLEERIRRDGKVKPGNVLKVDSFLNHQMDV